MIFCGKRDPHVRVRACRFDVSIHPKATGVPRRTGRRGSCSSTSQRLCLAEYRKNLLRIFSPDWNLICPASPTPAPWRSCGAFDGGIALAVRQTSRSDIHFMENSTEERRATVITHSPASDALSIQLGGRLDDSTLPTVWFHVLNAARQVTSGNILVDVSRVSYCDGAGLGLFAAIRRVAALTGSKLTFSGFAPDLQKLAERSSLSDPAAPELQPGERLSFVEDTGRATATTLNDLYALVVFAGHFLSAMTWQLRHPSRLRYRDLLQIAEKAGVNAAPIICLLGLLVGVILAFQCAIPMRRYGAQEAIPAVVSIALARELGPLIAAVLFAGRSGSAFTAEIGAMTISEEISALNCMGLDPVRFLVIPRVLAAMAMLPLLTMLCDITGILGGYSVMTNYGFSFIRYVHAVGHSISYVDLLGGIAKTVVFGAIIGGIGCLRGLRTASGPGAVGDSTTRSVVESIVFVIVSDAIFGIVYYYLGI